MAETNVYRAHALWVQGRRICGCISYTPVDMKMIENEFKTGAMDMAVTLDGGMERMTASFKVAGSDADVMSYFGLIPGVKTRFEIRSAFTDGSGNDFPRVDVYEGKITGITDDESGTDSKSDVGQVVNIAVDYYKRTQNGKEIYEIHPAKLIRRINGVNVLARIASILKIT
ncbi:phage major tail tube protein [Leclercia adecarboxylata]|uniref:phage major tail tube protein n=1 Tax=Leclercia adecarboxylata TaxID=83655 RepID=UPI002DBA665E|nr:phage major tail tube protein [Leclercia adecarboxylata]MEB5748654.1 phage major tail tube protein [Leclercia adecarboxylata]